MPGSSSSLFWAEWRRGLKDLQNAVLNPFNGITQTHEEAGTMGHPTMQIITSEMQGEPKFDQVRESYANRVEPEKQQESVQER